LFFVFVEMSGSKSDTIVLFDVDGTLTLPRQTVLPDMLHVLKGLKSLVTIGIVGGSNLEKIQEQLGENILEEYDFIFAENGTVAYHNGQLLKKTTMEQHLGSERFADLISFLGDYMTKYDVPVKTQQFMEIRTGMLNISPIGRKCSQAERDDFDKWDKQTKSREAIVEILKQKYESWGLKFSIGGQISIDVFPVGWDKTFCLQYVKDFKNIYFFGDKTESGGNDYEIYTSPLVSHPVSVKGPTDTIQQLKKFFPI